MTPAKATAHPKAAPHAKTATPAAVTSPFSGVYTEAVGRRKNASARVRLYDNQKSLFVVNGKPATEYLKTDKLIAAALQPLKVVGRQTMSVSVRVSGGGTVGQAEAIRHGVARALLKVDKDLRSALKPLELLTRDSREKERKKPGLKKARRAPQWAKR
ncbi:30S ribosomal protein S9 [Candidatus Falkowbacteria bacterium]|nr:30S ribosomal protein S9 [Candidatus Falkowbacteria bacterium]